MYNCTESLGLKPVLLIKAICQDINFLSHWKANASQNVICNWTVAPLMYSGGKLSIWVIKMPAIPTPITPIQVLTCGQPSSPKTTLQILSSLKVFFMHTRNVSCHCFMFHILAWMWSLLPFWGLISKIPLNFREPWEWSWAPCESSYRTTAGERGKWEGLW